jgi:uncharacterized membrane protein
MRWDVLAAILAMSAATFATRAGGYLVFRGFRPSEGIRLMLGYIPGTLFIAYVTPALADGGWPQWAGSAAAIGIMLASRQMAAAIFGGTAVAWAVWAWI